MKYTLCTLSNPPSVNYIFHTRGCLWQDMLVERLTASLERESATFRTLQEARREEMELAHALMERARLQEEELLHLGMLYEKREEGEVAKEGRKG